MHSAIRFELSHRCATSDARLGTLHTPHGRIDTPVFMPVGTQASVKGLLPEQLAQIGTQILLNNTYHLMLRPGSDRIARLGGVHSFMGWDKPILTDSGGFQVFSLTDANQIDDHGVTFRSHIDGQKIELTPERSMQVQNELGADIMMAFDDCPPACEADVPEGAATAGRHAVAVEAYAERNAIAAQRSYDWLQRCMDAHARPKDQALFGIVQGGTDLVLRRRCTEQLTAMDLPGYAIGGVAVGESHEAMMRVVGHTAPLLPESKPRYLMGVGYERDIVAAVRSGVDMFDCVLPTRNGRNANAFTPQGQVRLRNARFAEDPLPIDPECGCPVCGQFSRAYLRHLFAAGEMLGPILVSWHNLWYFHKLLLDIRQAIREDGWSLLWRRYPVLADDPQPHRPNDGF